MLKYNSINQNILILFTEIIMLSLFVAATYKMYTFSNTLEKALKEKENMIILSDELRQSSDDLTHFARTYTVTNNKEYKEKYVQTLAIRDGKVARPAHYETIYWDLDESIRNVRHPAGIKIALQKRIDTLPFSQQEKDLLKLAEFNSNDLVKLEVQAFVLMDSIGLNPNNQKVAIEMLHSKEYYSAKHKIMNPIDQFMLKLNQRTSENIEEINKNMLISLVVIVLGVVLLVFGNIHIYNYLRRQDMKRFKEKKETEQRYSKLIESSENWVWEIDGEGKYIYSSHQVTKLLGYEIEEVLGKTPLDFLTPREKIRVAKEFQSFVVNHERVVNSENINVHKNGNTVHMLTSASPFYNDAGELLGYRGMHSDITERKALEVALENHSKYLEEEVKNRTKDLEFQAHHDALTGLPNRLLFSDRLSFAIEKAKRNESVVALLFIDLDHFKEINDSLGHGVGDDVLKITTSRLYQTLRDEDMLARLGGDEFTIILEDLNLAQDASLVAEKILDVLSQSMNVSGHELYISSSIGISMYPDDGSSPDNLLKFADAAMYKAKEEGRNNYQYYNEQMTELAFERVVMETSLRTALKNEEFVVFYQPQVSGSNNTLIGMEALVRWKHPTMGLVSPAKFISLAESIGLIVDIDKYVMKTAMTQMARWYGAGLNPGKLSMNLAVKQLQQTDFIVMLKRLIQETKCKTEWLELEVTEGQIMTNPEEAIRVLKQVSDLGIELAIDDFGTGYSSLAYLKKFPIDKLKIDQAFVRGLPNNEEDAGITKAVIALAKSLNIRIIAEGVETQEQRDFIVENGCENIQGYFYSKPVSAAELEVILRNGF